MSPMRFNVSKTALGDTAVSGDLTFASGKGINFDTYGIKITDTYIQFGDDATALGPKLAYNSATSLKVVNAGSTDFVDFTCKNLACGDITSGNYTSWQTGAVNGSHITIKARDTDVGNVEVAHIYGAADPYFQIGRDDTGVALNAVTDGLKLKMAGGTGNSSAGQGFGMPFLLGNAASETEERASIDCVLVTATNGAEDARFDFNCMTAGAAPTTKFSCGAGGIGFFATTPAAQQAHIADSAGDDAAAVNAIIDALKAYGLLAPDP